jgi:hypothetical protein
MPARAAHRLQNKGRKVQQPFDYGSFKGQSDQVFMDTILAAQNPEVFKYHSVQLIVDHGWNRALPVLMQQTILYLCFFLGPFLVDIYYFSTQVSVYREITYLHNLVIVVGLLCQVYFFVCEMF